MSTRLVRPLRDSSKPQSATSYAEAIVSELVPPTRPGLRSCPAPAQSASPPQELCNLQAKAEFRARVAVVLKGDSIREQAKFFRVPHSTYNERISDRRTDLAPLAEWTERLDAYVEFQRLTAEFTRSA